MNDESQLITGQLVSGNPAVVLRTRERAGLRTRQTLNWDGDAWRYRWAAETVSTSVRPFGAGLGVGGYRSEVSALLGLAGAYLVLRRRCRRSMRHG